MAPRPTIGERLDSRDRLAALEALRAVLAAQIASGSASPRDTASLVGRMQSVLAEIADLVPAETKGTALDELDARRRSRGSDPARRERPAR